jgi:hypothetical protein
MILLPIAAPLYMAWMTWKGPRMVPSTLFF